MEKPVYEVKIDRQYAKENGLGKNQVYYIRESYPGCFLTDNMTYREAQKFAKSMRQLGFTVIDRTKEVPK